MAKFHKTLTINAPVDKVFAFMDDPRNLEGIWPSLVEVRDVKQNPKGGYDYAWTYRMAGAKIDGASVVTEYEVNHRIVTSSNSGIENQITWTLEPVDDGTRFTADAEYKVPIPLLGKLAEAVIVRQNEQEFITVCENLKSRMELETATA